MQLFTASSLLLVALYSVPALAQPLTSRRLEDGAAETFQYDLSTFSLRFDRCAYVKTFDDELAEDEDSTTVLALKHFVVFSLCPSDSCGNGGSTCDNGVHGRYAEDIVDYLGATVEYEQEAFENMCDNCNERCNEDGDSCSGCGQICYQWANLEAAGYVDASNFVECQKLDVQNDDDDGADDDAEAAQIYIGPRCSSDGSKITIALFSDENCWEPIDDKDAETVLGYKLSYHILSSIVSTENNDCISCAEEDGNDNDQQDEDNVNEMCEEVYASAAKCESKHGLAGFIMNANEDNEYENQVENEFMVCTFIDSLIWNSYTETGEINIVDEQDEVIRVVDGIQATAFSVLALSVVGLLAYGYFLHSKIRKITTKADLSSQGDGELS